MFSFNCAMMKLNKRQTHLSSSVKDIKKKSNLLMEEKDGHFLLAFWQFLSFFICECHHLEITAVCVRGEIYKQKLEE